MFEEVKSVESIQIELPTDLLPKILVIDDEFINQVFFEHSLKKLMILCDVAADGPSGLAMIRSRIEQAKDLERAVSNYKIIFID